MEFQESDSEEDNPDSTSESRMPAGADAENLNQQISQTSNGDNPSGIQTTHPGSTKAEQSFPAQSKGLPEEESADNRNEDSFVEDLANILEDEDLKDETVLGAIRFWREGKKPFGWKEDPSGSIKILTRFQKIRILKKGSQVYSNGVSHLTPDPEDSCKACLGNQLSAKGSLLL